MKSEWEEERYESRRRCTHFVLFDFFSAFQILLAHKKSEYLHMLRRLTGELYATWFFLLSCSTTWTEPKNNKAESKRRIDVVSRLQVQNAVVLVSSVEHGFSFPWRYNCHILPGSIKSRPRLYFLIL